MQSPPATWEFLEALNIELSQRLGSPPRTLVPVEDALASASGDSKIDATVVSVNPRLLTFLTEDEAVFMLARRLLEVQQLESMLHALGKNLADIDLKSMNRETSRTMLMSSIVGISVLAVAVVMSGGQEPIIWLLAAGCAFILLFGDRIIRWHFSNPDYRSKRMLKIAPQIHAKFDEVVRLVGNPDAGERYFRKAFVLNPTGCGEKPFDQDMRRKAQLNYEINVPPEYQVPGAIDSMAAILNS